MPFHIKHTGPAAVSMFLTREKMLKADEGVEKEQNENKEAGVEDVEMKSDLLDATPNPVSSPTHDLGVKAVDHDNVSYPPFVDALSMV